ncbi:K02A2.6-like [Cordylochernes scorpioides]|uniref:RNA-directed DNA polymerase n=1 Tax=Cordylochernes scorpioides TaxID=51811 RepID=A0ABY6LNF0_9ARAC|nr:K02A2.6-like [Cordylochernes scorpioides]
MKNLLFSLSGKIWVDRGFLIFAQLMYSYFSVSMQELQTKRLLTINRNVSNGDEELTPVPFSIKEKIDKELDRLEKSQIIEKVNASDWSTPLVTVIKSNGELRLCGDFKNTLNNCIEDEKYPLPTIETMLGNLGGNKIFTKLDLSSAYHQIEMDEASKNLLVVSTHRGLYRYNRLPFGISPASAIFQRCMDSLFHDVPNTVIYLDDIFIGSKDEQEHYRILKIIFDKLKELNFTLNKEKCLFLKKDICFLGHIINEDGVRPDSKKLEALERCKKPFDKTSLKSFLGMLSFYSKYIPNMSTLAGPLYQLLKKDNRWKWSSQCEKAFLNLKLTLLNSQALIHYSMKLPLTLTCDASAYGISGVLCHIVEGEEKPITFVSRTLSSAEVKYSQTEKEALAIVFATSKLRQYLFGRKFVLKSDHKALTTVFGNKRLLPPLIANRLHRWALELSNFDFDIRYTNKDTMLCADAFSRLPLEEMNSREDNIDLVTHDISFLNVTPLDHLIIEEETNKDPVLNKLKEYLLEDPQLAKKDETMKPFLSKLENFSVLQGCIFVDSRAVIPSTCQDQMLKLLHQSHIGINRMKSLARSSVWWPKMDSQIEEFVKECSPCMHHQTAPPAENTPWPRTNQPWQRVHVDHFYFRGDCYLLVVDANSNWIEVFPVRGTTSQENIKLLRECFARDKLECRFDDSLGFGIFLENVLDKYREAIVRSEAKSIDKAVSAMATVDSVEHRCSFMKGVCSVEGVEEINSIKGKMKMLSTSVNRMKHENEQCIKSLRGEIEKLTKLLCEIKLSPPECRLGHIASDCSRQSSMFANRNTLDNDEIVNIRSYGGDQFGNLPIVKVNINGNMWHLLYDTGSKVNIIDSEKCKVLKENWDDVLKTSRIVSATGHEQTLCWVQGG